MWLNQEDEHYLSQEKADPPGEGQRSLGTLVTAISNEPDQKVQL